jgi:nicotinate-nucleotide adenylyltransferase
VTRPEPGGGGRKLGLLGGSFDPIHDGHLVMGEEARVQLGLDRVVFIPAAMPPHKLGRTDLSSARHRLRMTELAVAGNEGFAVDELELRRTGGPSFTIDTLRHFHAQQQGSGELYFIMGLDSFLEIQTWKEHERFLELGHLIVATRAGYDASRMDHDVPGPILERLVQGAGPSSAGGHRVWFIEIPPVATSSTQIRSRHREGRSIRYLVPESVWHYIQEHRLYR